VIYAADAAGASLLHVSDLVARRERAPPGAPRSGRRGGPAPTPLQGLAVPVVFLLSIGDSLFSPRAAMYSWLLLSVTDPIIRWVLSR
jgi:hypothetical protein